MGKNPQAENGHTDIAHEVLEALARIRIPGEAMQVFLFIMRKTWGWKKKTDRIPLSQFVDGTGLLKTHVCAAIKMLESMHLIITEKGNELHTSYCINKHYNTWKPLPKKVTLPKKVIGGTEKGNKPLPNSVHSKETTKETISKEKESIKEKHENFVFLTLNEYGKLVEQFGEQGTKDRIKNLNMYIGSKGKKYKSHYFTILNWDRKDKKEQKEKQPSKNPRPWERPTSEYEEYEKTIRYLGETDEEYNQRIGAGT
jgi:phage replication O-like protein O